MIVSKSSNSTYYCDLLSNCQVSPITNPTNMFNWRARNSITPSFASCFLGGILPLVPLATVGDEADHSGATVRGLMSSLFGCSHNTYFYYYALDMLLTSIYRGNSGAFLERWTC